MNHLQSLIDLIFKEEPTVNDLAKIILALAVFWGAAFELSIPILSKHFRKQPWFRQLSDSDYERDWKDISKLVGVKESKDEYYERFSRDCPYWILVLFQHFVGGALCLPAVLGTTNPSTAASLACLGIMCEIAYEVSDTFSWLYRRYCTPNGKQKVPGALLLLAFFHHSLGCGLGVPMILNYRNLSALHWLCFELQLAAAVALAVQWITKALDVSDRSQRRLFVQLSVLCFVVMVITRLIHWPVLVGQIVMVWYQEEAWVSMAVGIPVCMLFSFFSWAFAIAPGWKRIVKFWNVPEQSQPAKNANKRRSSCTTAIQAAARVAAQVEDSRSGSFVHRLDVPLKLE